MSFLFLYHTRYHYGLAWDNNSSLPREENPGHVNINIKNN